MNTLNASAPHAIIKSLWKLKNKISHSGDEKRLSRPPHDSEVLNRAEIILKIRSQWDFRGQRELSTTHILS